MATISNLKDLKVVTNSFRTRSYMFQNTPSIFMSEFSFGLMFIQAKPVFPASKPAYVFVKVPAFKSVSVNISSLNHKSYMYECVYCSFAFNDTTL